MQGRLAGRLLVERALGCVDGASHAGTAPWPYAPPSSTSPPFPIFAVGDTIPIHYNNKKFSIDIIEAKPSDAISVVETDCSVRDTGWCLMAGALSFGVSLLIRPGRWERTRARTHTCSAPGLAFLLDWQQASLANLSLIHRSISPLHWTMWSLRSHPPRRQPQVHLSAYRPGCTGFAWAGCNHSASLPVKQRPWCPPIDMYPPCSICQCANELRGPGERGAGRGTG